MDFQLSEHEQTLLLHTARESIASALENRKGVYPSPTGKLNLPLGLFVSIFKEGHLRGCIGQMSADRPVFEGVKDMAKSAAFNDPRFPALTRTELEDVNIEISILSSLTPITSPEDIEVGKHGLYIKQESTTGVLLPQVAAEHKWTTEEFLEHTCKKANLSNDCWKNRETEVLIFSAFVFGESQ